jgi:KEOPS complex subunit Cgi121
LIKRIEGFDKYIGVTGFRNVRIEDAKSFLDNIRKKTEGVSIQFFNANLIAGPEHLYFAALNALKAFEGNLNISNSLAMETLVYACAQRQIRKAVELLGIKDESSEVAVLVLAETEAKVRETLEAISEFIHGTRDDNVIQLSDEKFEIIKEFFGISKFELEAKLEKKGFEKEALINLVIEHMALLATEH